VEMTLRLKEVMLLLMAVEPKVEKKSQQKMEKQEVL
jgi:hypothetical protein